MPALAWTADVVEVGRLPPDHRAERDEAVDLPRGGQCLRGGGKLPGARHPDDADRVSATPWRRRQSTAPATSRSTTAPLNRDATTAKRLPAPSSRPSIVWYVTHGKGPWGRVSIGTRPEGVSTAPTSLGGAQSAPPAGPRWISSTRAGSGVSRAWTTARATSSAGTIFERSHSPGRSSQSGVSVAPG